MDDGSYLVFGGFSGQKTLNDLLVVDARTTEWKATPLAAKAPPAARSRGTMVYDTSKKMAYIYGGRANGNDLSDGDVHVLDVGASAWSTIIVNPRPTALVGSSIVWNQDCSCAYLFGGSSAGDVHAETWRLDTAPTVHFTKLDQPAMPSARFDASFVAIPGQKRALLFAGANGTRGSGKFMNDVWSFDFQTEKWSEVTVQGDLPTARRGAFAALDRTRKRLIIGLGESRSGALDDLASFDIATSTWSQLPFVWDTKNEAERIFPLSLSGETHDGWMVGGLNDNFASTSEGAFTLDLGAR